MNTEQIREAYTAIFERYDLDKPIDAGRINTIIRDSLNEFMKDCEKPAIYCYGEHTQVLMSDFISELRKVKIIIDNYVDTSKAGGFKLIRDSEIEANGIDGVVLSTYKFRRDVTDNMCTNHPSVKYLDLYEKIEDAGIAIQSDFYFNNHPYHHYKTINAAQRKLAEADSGEDKDALYRILLSQYLQIKDFLNASLKANEWYSVTGNESIKGLATDIDRLYAAELDLADSISDRNVLMMCIDGLRREDFSEDYMPKLIRGYVQDAYYKSGCYSYSTSTYESLLPVYSECSDMRTQYYTKEYIDGSRCRFLDEAKKQNRKVVCYTDFAEYIKDDYIEYSDSYMTATEKLWNFVLDASNEDNGLYYIHIMHESHFTFSNPYTTTPLMAEGTAMLFDFLPIKGGKLRIDYAKQHEDALRYLDDVVTPVLEKLKCRTIIYADHGNLILPYDCTLENVDEAKYSCAEEWIRIPFMIKSPELGSGGDNQLMSLFAMNGVLIDMMNHRKPDIKHCKWVKIGRSQIYNPDFQALYKMADVEEHLMAFEGFIFESGEKLIVFSDGSRILFSSVDDSRINDDSRANELYQMIAAEVTVMES